MMKRDFKKYKVVAGEKILNKIYENRFNKTQKYQERDINEKRLTSWEIPNQISERDSIRQLHHQESTPSITKFKSSKKIFGSQANLHQVETYEASFKSSIKIATPVPKEVIMHPKIRRPPEISEELKIINEMNMLLPHMRTTTPNGRQINVKHLSQFKNSEELDIMNQMKTELPHMRTKSPNGRVISQPVTHTLSNQTDFINQKKYFLPSMQSISPNSRMAFTERNHSQFSLVWEG